MRFYFMPIRMAVKRKLISADEDVDKLESSYITGGHIKRCIWRTVWQFLKLLNNGITT